VQGSLSQERPLLLVGNHLSYLDVFVLGSLAPLSFTPKKEVRRWPVIGFLCVMADCVFVERKPSEINQAKEQMERRLDKDKIVCLFPEGTTSDGRGVLPFKSGFFSLAEEYDMPVQPVTTRYTHIGDEPMVDARRADIAWVGEATFFGHVRGLLALPSITATITLHPLLMLKDFEDRKALAKAAEAMIRAEVTHAR
jgi:1-acyl-sn-glycerol-3-phosphate acyltransferase